MNVQYLSDDKGQIKAVQVAIEDWERLKLIHPDIDELNNQLPEWQKKVLDLRLQTIADNPDSLRPISELFDTLDRDVE